MFSSKTRWPPGRRCWEYAAMRLHPGHMGYIYLSGKSLPSESAFQEWMEEAKISGQWHPKLKTLGTECSLLPKGTCVPFLSPRQQQPLSSPIPRSSPATGWSGRPTRGVSFWSLSVGYLIKLHLFAKTWCSILTSVCHTVSPSWATEAESFPTPPIT